MCAERFFWIDWIPRTKKVSGDAKWRIKRAMPSRSKSPHSSFVKSYRRPFSAYIDSIEFRQYSDNTSLVALHYAARSIFFFFRIRCLFRFSVEFRTTNTQAHIVSSESKGKIEREREKKQFKSKWSLVIIINDYYNHILSRSGVKCE